ncbi:MAG: hypothetical protein MJY72_05440 [Bacteroidales bacterium]|nr:hypothetical protein [Bacteroidales bacterium]
MSIKRITSALLLIALAAASFAGCRREPKPTPREEIPHVVTEFNDAGAYYFGEFKNDIADFNMFCTYLLSGKTRIDDRVISGVGTALWLDMNVEINDKNELAVAEYTPARNEYSLNAFLKGGYITTDNEEKISGSYIYYRPLNGPAQYKLITNGKVTVNITNGKTYSIKATVLADGEEFVFDYYGYFAYTDVVIPTPTPEYIINDFKFGRLEDLGQPWKDYQNIRDWKLILGDDTKWVDGRELQFELITSSTANDIVGHYEVLTEEFNESTIKTALVPGSSLCGYIDGDEYFGTWLFPNNDDRTWLGATSGTVDINKSGDVYTITFDFIDGFTDNARFKGKYVGKLEGGVEPQPDVIEINNFRYGLIEDLGQPWSSYTGIRDWKVLLGDDTKWADGREIQFELITSRNATDITGSYEVLTEEFTESTMKAALVSGSALCGYIDGTDYFGTWLFPTNDEETWLGATGGTVEVSKSGSTYTITFDLVDKFSDGTRFKGSYTGSMQKKSNSAAMSPRRMSSPVVSMQKAAARTNYVERVGMRDTNVSTTNRHGSAASRATGIHRTTSLGMQSAASGTKSAQRRTITAK